ncbi:MAG TPA: hypothetical protein VFY35_16570 [Burkholderiaceae bacterium]|nr:hypothetical protein [Burkholderiaceae bacterium]
MLPTLHGTIRQFKNHLMPTFTDVCGTRPHRPHPHAAPLPSTPDWHIPAYLRRRLSGDALPRPWPPRH